MENKNFKPIPGYDKLYLISPNGEVYSLITDRIMTPHTSNNGYLRIGLTNAQGSQTKYSIHRLVYSAYGEEELDPKKAINHKDGNKSNNSIGNLEQITFSENNQHALDTGLRRPPGRRPVIQLTLNDEYVAEYESISAAARAVNGSSGTLTGVLKGRTYCHKGYKWKYKEEEAEKAVAFEK